MLIKCEFKIRPEALERIEGKLCSISEDEDVVMFSLSNGMTGNVWNKVR